MRNILPCRFPGIYLLWLYIYNYAFIYNLCIFMFYILLQKDFKKGKRENYEKE